MYLLAARKVEQRLKHVKKYTLWISSGNSYPHSSLEKTTCDLFPRLRSDKLSWCKRNVNTRLMLSWGRWHDTITNGSVETVRLWHRNPMQPVVENKTLLQSEKSHNVNGSSVETFRFAPQLVVFSLGLKFAQCNRTRFKTFPCIIQRSFISQH